MKLRQIAVKNFRCLEDVVVPISDFTVFLGENNTGKTALLDALRFALTRSGSGRSSPFSEYDYYMESPGDSPQSSQGIVVELWFREDRQGEWPDSLVQALEEIVRTDLTKDLDSIGLRITSRFDSAINDFRFGAEFLALDGQPLAGRGANPRNIPRFQNYVRLFYLSSLRDADVEFSPRSQFWGRILRDLKISPEQRDKLTEELGKLNDALLKGDPRLDEVSTTLNQIQMIMGIGSDPRTSIQALPLKPWDLMSKAAVVIKSRGSEVEFPLAQHGQGLQSLAVLFVFQAYIQVMLKPSFEPETEAILSLEEPEAHLHPQAVRALARNFQGVEGQKIISTHSPYFVQEVPFTDLRVFRREGAATRVLFVKQSFRVNVPVPSGLSTYCASNLKFKCDPAESTLTVSGQVTRGEYRDLLKMYPGQPDVHAQLKRLAEESQLYLSDEDLSDLETFAKRVRGEILFARGWLLCEGQSEYLLLRRFAEMLGNPLDEAGIAVIDFQNNGSPSAFVGLARVFEIPWLMVCDSDAEGKRFAAQVKSRGLSTKEAASLIRPLPGEGVNWERFLITNGFLPEIVEVLAERGHHPGKHQGEDGFDSEVAAMLEKDKRGYAAALTAKLQQNGADASRVPAFISSAIGDMVSMVV